MKSVQTHLAPDPNPGGPLHSLPFLSTRVSSGVQRERGEAHPRAPFQDTREPLFTREMALGLCHIKTENMLEFKKIQCTYT